MKPTFRRPIRSLAMPKIGTAAVSATTVLLSGTTMALPPSADAQPAPACTATPTEVSPGVWEVAFTESCEWTAPAGMSALEALLVGAGGGTNLYGYAGGGGDVRVVSLTSTATGVSVSVGKGTAPDLDPGRNSEVNDGTVTETAVGGQDGGTSGNGNTGVWTEMSWINSSGLTLVGQGFNGPGGGAGGPATWNPPFASFDTCGTAGPGAVVSSLAGTGLFQDDNTCYGGGGGFAGAVIYTLPTGGEEGGGFFQNEQPTDACGGGSVRANSSINFSVGKCALAVAASNFTVTPPAANSGGGAGVVSRNPMDAYCSDLTGTDDFLALPGASAGDGSQGTNATGADGRVVLRYTLLPTTSTTLIPPTSTTLPPPVCGNGVVEEGEQCDDGNNDNTDACLNTCVSATCGDGFVYAAVEGCDDGNTADGDGCSANCTIEGGACCLGAGCMDGVTPAVCDAYSGSFGGAGSKCSDPGVCVNCGDGVLQYGEACEDGNTGAGDGCSATCQVEACWTCSNAPTSTTSSMVPAMPEAGAALSVCEPDNTQTCDDGVSCSVNDHCSAGTCTGDAPIIPATCDWVMVAGGSHGLAQARARSNVIVSGDICGQSTRIDDKAGIDGDVVATSITGKKGSRFGINVEVTGDVVTGGAPVNGKPAGVKLPGLDTDFLAGGSTAEQTSDPERDYDTTGTDPRVAACQASLDSIDTTHPVLDALPSDGLFPKTYVASNGTLTLEATDKLTVIDYVKLMTGNNVTITLDGKGIPDVAFVIRINKKLYPGFGTTINFVNGASPARTVFYGRAVCKFGEQTNGGGTVFCPFGKIKMNQKSVWNGALITGRKRVDLRHQVDLIHVPIEIPAP